MNPADGITKKNVMVRILKNFQPRMADDAVSNSLKWKNAKQGSTRSRSVARLQGNRKYHEQPKNKFTITNPKTRMPHLWMYQILQKRKMVQARCSSLAGSTSAGDHTEPGPLPWSYFEVKEDLVKRIELEK